ncbi:MAG: hypothetical protein AB7N24_05885 [Dehalococcoidia bacterium]
MTIKATSVLSILAIWIASVVAVAIEPDSWWLLIFTFLATGAVGVSAWRRLGISRLLAITGTWAGVAFAAGSTSDATWVSIFAFLTTGAVVFSTMSRSAWLLGAGIAVAWLAVGISVLDEGPDAAWMCIFAFLTAGSVANSHHSFSRGIAAMVWWGATAILVIAFGAGLAWVSVLAFLLTTLSFGIGGFQFPRGMEWDLWDKDDDGERVKIVR